MRLVDGMPAVLKIGSIAAIILYTTFSCSNLKNVDRQITPADSAMTLNHKSPYLKAHMKNGRVYVLKSWSVDNKDSLVSGKGYLYGINRNLLKSSEFKIGLDSVALFETNVVYQSGSVIALSVITGASLALTVGCMANPKACFGSCPTFYISDGSKPILQAEGFSSSIAPSLEATDVDALYRAHPKSKTVTIQMRNEALETHMVRYVNLLTVPKKKDERVFKDIHNNFWLSNLIETPDSCVGPEGDIRDKIAAFDGNERYSLTDSTNLAKKEYLDLWFDHVPKGKTGLVVASRQTLLSTYLFYQTLSYMGKNIGTWLSQLRFQKDFFKNGDLADLLGRIDVMIQDSTGRWNKVGSTGEQGPLATDVFLVPLPKRKQHGPLHIRLRMTRGDWRIDYLALASLNGKAKPDTIEPSLVMKQGNPDELALHYLTDNSRKLIMLPGDKYDLSYQLPDSADNYELFLQSHGYYLEWMRREWEHKENYQKLVQLLFTPGIMLKELAPAYKKIESHMENEFWRSRYAHPFK
jgi:hypothetical protein